MSSLHIMGNWQMNPYALTITQISKLQVFAAVICAGALGSLVPAYVVLSQRKEGPTHSHWGYVHI